jgi:hypothetical protein
MRPGLKGALIAATVATLFAGRVIAAEQEGGGSEAKTIHCVGANACKGQSACKGASNDCAGKNACKGKGFIKTTTEDCKAKGGKVEG